MKTEGADKADFRYSGDDSDQEFHSLYEKLRKKRAQFFQEIGKEKDNNLIKKNEILVLLREIIDGEDQESFNKVKKLQEEWKEVGPVPGAQNHSLWASYHALMDRFYDHRSIYFELKELDRKKNLASKIELCKKAETLDAAADRDDHLSECCQESGLVHCGSGACFTLPNDLAINLAMQNIRQDVTYYDVGAGQSPTPHLRPP